ncbi:hypothetical protein [Mycobacterium sp.]|uniref:hypothetical protein n=1 Tax=Mycobacterium sp. TaxID=1785 RepID=UPI0026208980|nr:hypothetical protein [Mycobacterium sp.]
MTEQAIEQAAAPVIEAAAKALEPAAAALLASAEQHLLAEAQRLKAEIDASHNSILVWLREHLAGQTTAAS